MELTDAFIDISGKDKKDEEIADTKTEEAKRNLSQLKNSVLLRKKLKRKAQITNFKLELISKQTKNFVSIKNAVVFSTSESFILNTQKTFYLHRKFL